MCVLYNFVPNLSIHDCVSFKVAASEAAFNQKMWAHITGPIMLDQTFRN